MTGHVPTLVLKEILSCCAEDNGYQFVAVYEGRGGGYEEAVSWSYLSLPGHEHDADGIEAILRSWLTAVSTILGVSFIIESLIC